MSEYLSFCMGCMAPSSGKGSCPHCGYPSGGVNPPEYLPVRTLLADRYLIGRVLKTGGGTALYMAYDVQQKAPIRVREFCPDALCERAEDGSVMPRGGCRNVFEEYREKFLQHARGIAKLRDLPCAVPIYDIFEENGSAYTVEEPCEGVLLEQRLQQLGGRIRWDDIRPLVMSLLTTLSAFHSAGLYHLGISPRSLLLGRDGRMHLTDWYIPAARTVGGEIKPEPEACYAAPEQYAFGASCGAAADVYGVTAVLFRMLTGTNPPDRSLSGNNGLMIPAEVARELPEHIKAVLVGGLRVNETQRIATVEELRDKLSAEPVVTMLKTEPTVSAPVKKEKKTHQGAVITVTVILLFLVLLAAAFGVLVMLYPELNPFAPSAQSAVSSQMPSSAPVSSGGDTSLPGTTFVVNNVVGKDAYQLRDQMKEQPLNGGMTVEIVGKVFSDTYPRGTVVSQSPAAGELAPSQTVIQITVSLGPEAFEMPDVSGWTAEAARAYLEALGLRVTERTIDVSSYDKGLVQETTPAVGAVVRDGERVTIAVSNVEQPKPAPEQGEETTE